jgi:uncharacterized membrane protein YraQ (UPF0718 family)
VLLPALALSVLGLLLGAALVTLGRRQALASAALDGFSLGFVPAVLALRMLPHAMGSLGVRALALAALAYLALWWVDRRAHDRDHAAAHPFHPAAGAGAGLLVPMLAVHGMSDGAALAVALSSRGVGASLAAALILHRMPEGLFIASSMLPSAGGRKTAVALGALALSTVVGAALGQALLDAIPDALFDGALALGVGAMLRLAMHSHAARPPTAHARALAGLTFLGGVALVLALPDPGGLFRRAHPSELSVQGALVPLFVETAPSMLLGVLGAGLLRTLSRARPEAWLRGGNSLAQALRGAVFGAPLQVCSCGVLPVARAMLRGSLPIAAVAAFMVGTPELDVGGFVLSVRLLGLPLALARLAAGAALAVVVGLVTAAVARSLPLRVPPKPSRRPGLLVAPRALPSTPPPAARTVAGVLRAGLDSFDQVAAWYVFGLLLAAGFEAAVAPAVLAHAVGRWDVALTALLAVPVYVCAQGATPLAAVMVHKGFSPGSALALLLVGPATHVAAWRMLRQALGARVAWSFVAASVVGAVALGALANRVVPAATLPEIHALAAHAHPPWELGAAAVLALLLAGSVLRLGPRAWVGTMSPTGAPAEHGHHHHPH